MVQAPTSGATTPIRRAASVSRFTSVPVITFLLLALMGAHIVLDIPTRPASLVTSPPQFLTIQPDSLIGTDTFIIDAIPEGNYGDNASLLVGLDPGTGSLARSLLRFDLSGLAPDATILDAALQLYRTQGNGGVIQVRRALSGWTEGEGNLSRTMIPVTVTETAGVPRIREPVGIVLSFAPDSIEDPQKDLLVFEGPSEVPSQVYRYTYNGSNLSGALVYFGVTVGPMEAKTFNITYGPGGATVPSYRAKNWTATPLWTFGPTGGGASGASIIDLDGDGELEVVFGGANGYVYALNATGQQVWASQLSTTRSVPYTPQVVDLDADGNMDIVVIVSDPAVVRLNRTGGVVWRTPYNVGNMPYSTPTLLDVNDDGVLDVLIGGRFNRVEALNGIDGTVLRTYPSGDWTYTSSVADLDGDGRGEFFFASDDSMIHAYHRNGTQLWANGTPSSTFIEISVAIGDIDGDGVLEALTGDDANGGPVFALRATNGTLVWSRNTPTWKEGGMTLADLDGDGTLETIVGDYSGMVLALRGMDGTVLWNYTDTAVQPLYPAVVDVNRDGEPEIIYLEEGSGGQAAVRVLNRTGALLHRWNVTRNNPGLRTLSQYQMATPAVADIDGDGTMEVIVPTGNGLEAFATGGLARDWRTWGYNWNHTHGAGDGSSPEGVPFLTVSLGPPETIPGLGASWRYRDGLSPWTVEGGDFDIPEAIATASVGWMSWNVTPIVSDWHGGRSPNVGLFLTEADEVSGSRQVFESSDSFNASLWPRLVIIYTVPLPDTSPKIIGTIPNQIMLEDGPPVSLDLTLYASDPDTSLQGLWWNISGYDSKVLRITGQNTPGNHILTLQPRKDAWGSFYVTYWLTDTSGQHASQNAWINVTPINDPPFFDPPPSLVVRYDSPYTFNFGPYIADVDDSIAQLTLSSDDPQRASVSGLNVTFLYPKSYLNQSVSVTLTVDDGKASTSKVIVVRVTSDYPPIVFLPLPDITLTEGERKEGVFDLDDYFDDPDGDILFYTYGYSNVNITIHANHSVDIEASGEWSGTEQVTFRAIDPYGAIAEDVILVTVLPIDDPPSLGPIPDLRVHYDELYTFNLEPYIFDPDTPMEEISVSASSPYVSVVGRLLMLLYPVGLNNTVQNLTISASDGTSEVSKTIRVTVGDDYPPVLKAKLPDRFFMEDTQLAAAYNLSLFFEDPEGDVLYYSSGNVSVLVTIGDWGVVDLRAARDWSGAERVTFRATDPLDGLSEDTVWIRVLPINDPPYFRPIPRQVLNQTTAYLDLRPYLGDVDNEMSELTLSTSSQNATIIGLGVLFNYQGDATENVEIVVSDGSLTNRTTISVVVALPPPGVPTYLFWLPLPFVAAAVVAFVIYRYRKVEWAFLVNNAGLLICSASRKGRTPVDLDLMSATLTAITNAAEKSFSDETERRLEEFVLGEKRVAIVRGTYSYLSAVYLGRTPGSLLKLMRSTLGVIEGRHEEALEERILESSELGDIPEMLQDLIIRGSWPFRPSAETVARELTIET